MSEGPTFGEWTQYGWIPDGASSFPARVRLRNAAWMVYYEPETGTCHNESEYPQMFFICSECGCAHKRNRAYVDMPHFCPNCGAKVVTE